MLYSLALFFTILVFVMYKNYIKIKFFISWWAFTFPMAAVSIATILMYKLTHESIICYIGLYLYGYYNFCSVFSSKRDYSSYAKKKRYV